MNRILVRSISTTIFGVLILGILYSASTRCSLTPIGEAFELVDEALNEEETTSSDVKAAQLFTASIWFTDVALVGIVGIVEGFLFSLFWRMRLIDAIAISLFFSMALILIDGSLHLGDLTNWLGYALFLFTLMGSAAFSEEMKCFIKSRYEKEPVVG